MINKIQELSYCFLKPELCIGNDKCQEGYSGALCENCDILNGYYEVDKL